MTTEWPVRADAPPLVRPTRPAFPRGDIAGRRLADAALDLSLDPANRIDDRVRAFASAMRDDLVAMLEGDMRRRLIAAFPDDDELGASLAAPSIAIALPLLLDAGLLRHEPLVAILLRCAESFVLADRLAPDRDGVGLPTDASDPEVAAAATAVLIAEARRVDRFGAPMLLFHDLPAEVAHRFVWSVAAALRRYLRVRHAVDDARAEASVIQAATALLATHDEGEGLEAAAIRLAFRMTAGGRINGMAMIALLNGGQVNAFTAVLASATGLPFDEAWRIIAEPDGGRLAITLRAAGVGRQAAAAILLKLLPATGDAGSEIELFDEWDEAAAREALTPLSVDPAFRAAVRALDAALCTQGRA